MGSTEPSSATWASTDDPWPGALERVLADPRQPRLVFQPIVDLRRATVVGYETLARFDGPPPASPDVWLKRAAEAGVGPALEARVIEAALALRDALPPNSFLTVNVNPNYLLTPQVAGALGAAGRLDRLVLELTERQAITEPECLNEALRVYRQAGAFVAIDDAGAGYAGLHALLTVRPQFIKLDRSLVSELDHQPPKRAAARLLGAFASEIDAWLLAEGIERPEELEELIRLDVPLAQGYLLGRPQAGWRADVPESVRALIHAMNARPREAADRVATLVERAITVRGPDRVRAAGATVVHLDHQGRPRALSSPQGDAGPTQLLLVKASEHVKQIGQRMAARETAQRFVPAVCCDETGRYTGIVRVERILAGLSG